ncbi:MAG: alpha-L-fucosidase [Chitinophagaceae bacterium]
MFFQQSLAAGPVPPSHSNAKPGILIHWGLYSVPAWATYTITWRHRAI